LLGADSRHVRGWLGRIAATACAVIAVACLSACGGGPGSPSSGSSFWSSATSLLSRSTKVAVAPIIGTPPQVAQDLTDALVAAGKDRSLTLIPGGSGGSYTLRGYLVASNERGGAKITYIWDVTDAKGGRVARVSGDEMVAARAGGDPWAGVDSATLRSIAGKTTSQLAASLSRGGSAPAAVAASEGTPATTATAPRPTAAVSPKSAGVVVAPVSGAPGDGQRSLTTALKKRLYAGGIKLANGTADGVYMVKGSVVLSDASGGKQSIRIDWLVLDPSGKRLGTVSQQNTIPRGSLNGPWGAIADAAAGAAADGIIKLLPKSS
jgi:hypothetical protein